MTSTQNAGNDFRTRDAANTSPLMTRTASALLPTSNHRFSHASNDTPESSKASSIRNSYTAHLSGDADAEDAPSDVLLGKDGGGSHRSHRSRNSGGFLLSETAFEPPLTASKAADHAPQRALFQRDYKGKAAVRAPEKKHVKNRSRTGLGIGGSPLAANVTTAGHGAGGDSTVDEGDVGETVSVAKPPNRRLDVDSAQIVNLALNLSESRRAARRNASSPLPPPVPAFGESFAGGSLRQHLQQQRRVSRNVSPKPDRGDRAVTASPRLASGPQKVNSPLKPAFDYDQDGSYQYHFSPSTMARAEKAKKSLELMAHYRRLLQYLPPLKPQALERSVTAGSNILETPAATSVTISASTTAPRQLGREYNPLQYIRNRKVRARERRAIDGEAQGFGDLDKVSSWVDQVEKEALSQDYQAADCLLMPAFSKAADTAASSHKSPSSTLGKAPAAQAKIKRPRVDWITNAADMIADIFWLEQDDNKKSIEDRNGKMIFPPTTELKRPLSRRDESPQNQSTPISAKRREETEFSDLRIDTKMPEFRSLRLDSGKNSDSATSRAKHKLREATRIHHGHKGSINRHRLRIRSHSRSDSASSDGEAAFHPQRRRSGTADSHDRAKDILEKQMIEMLANEASHSSWDSEAVNDRHVTGLVEPEKPLQMETSVKSQNSPRGSVHGPIVNKETNSRRGSFKNGSSGRVSLEVTGFGLRASLEGLDSTAPNSPQLKASKGSASFVPSIGMDLSSSLRSRPSSPTRNPLSRVKSRINQFQDHSRDRSRSRSRVPYVDAGIDQPSKDLISKEAILEGPMTPERQKRSTSPIKKVKTNDGSKPSIRKAGSFRRGKTSEEGSGIRGLFKGSRNPVTRVGDFIWKKDPPSAGQAPGFSTDESDIEDNRIASKKRSFGNSPTAIHDDIDVASPQIDKPSFLSEMPVFRSSFSEHRGRPTRTQSSEIPGSAQIDERQAREERRKSSRAHMLKPPPRIDVQNASPTSSPDLPPQDRYQDSSVSDVDSRRGSFAPGVYDADARLNAILGIPGKRSNSLFVTGLSALDPDSNRRLSLESKRRWSISDRGVSVHRGPITKQQIDRVKALLLSSGIKAKEISRRAAEIRDLRLADEKIYADIAPMAQHQIGPVPKSQEHILAARILTDDIQLSSSIWQTSADNFTSVTVQSLLDRIGTLRRKVVDELTPMTSSAADEADEVSRDLVTSQTLKVKSITDSIDGMLRQRRRKFRWLRRGGWLVVEWALVGVMWLAWFVVVFVKIVMGVGNAGVHVGRWLFFQ